uniref:RNA-directed DNA polymerase n=1 Tax=Trichuris muris TaxID=70415 RepID=A0A5S6QW85_TRIMR
MLDPIHCGHQGIVRCKDRARESIWWPGMNHEIEQMVENCFRCASLRQIRHEPMLPAELPAYPWQVVGTDILSFRDKDYLVVVDYYPMYIELSLLPDKTTGTGINLMKSMFSRHGIPETVRCDNGPCYSAFEFSEFAKAYQFQLITSSPKYAQSNGEAESAVATVRKMIEKCDDLYLALLAYRTTPLASGFSPAELLFGRKLRTNVPILQSHLLPRKVNHEAFRQRDAAEKRRQCIAYNRRHGTRFRQTLEMGQKVLVQDRKQDGSVVGRLHLAHIRSGWTAEERYAGQRFICCQDDAVDQVKLTSLEQKKLLPDYPGNTPHLSSFKTTSLEKGGCGVQSRVS